MARTVDDQILERLDQILCVLALQVASDKSITEGASGLSSFVLPVGRAGKPCKH